MIHGELAAGRWQTLSLVEQMANIGSEVSRAISARARQKPEYAVQAVERALELTDLTLAGLKNYARLKEVARGREILVDYFMGDNQYGSSERLLRAYYDAFALAARRNR